MTVFLIIGGLGLALLVISLIVGDVFGDLFGGALEGLAGDAFSSAVIGGFVAALGFGGGIADALGAPLPLAVGVGVVAGLLFGWFAAWLTKIVRGGGSDATPSTADAVGRDATVITDIPAGGYGVVRVGIGGHLVQFNARADQPVAVGTPVYVTEIISPTAVAVTPNWPELPSPSV